MTNGLNGNVCGREHIFVFSLPWVYFIYIEPCVLKSLMVIIIIITTTSITTTAVIMIMRRRRRRI